VCYPSSSLFFLKSKIGQFIYTPCENRYDVHKLCGHVCDIDSVLPWLQTFLQLDELSDREFRVRDDDRPPINQCRIVIDNVHAKWDKVKCAALNTFKNN